MSLDLNLPTGAVISDCGTHRYALWRIWDHSKGLVMFIMLNPSTADGTEPDPTITRCIDFAKTWGYGGILVGNQFSYRSSKPKDLLTASELNGPRAWHYLLEMAEQAEIIVKAWGNIHKKLKHHTDKPSLFISSHKVFVLRMTKQNEPWHPLYLPKTTVPYRVDEKEIIVNGVKCETMLKIAQK